MFIWGVIQDSIWGAIWWSFGVLPRARSGGVGDAGRDERRGSGFGVFESMQKGDLSQHVEVSSM